MISLWFGFLAVALAFILMQLSRKDKLDLPGPVAFPMLGMLFGNGEMWDKSRKWTVRNLRDFGFGKSHLLEASVNNEIENFLENLEKGEKDPCKIILPVSHTFLVPVSRVMYKMMAGYDTKIENETLVEMNRQDGESQWNYGNGKRGCPGELFADVTAFLMAMNLIKKYKLSTVPGEPKPKLAMHIGLTSCPHEFSMLMTKRQ
ncbi:Cytochrome P450 2L1 [Folsomia candida]|uniref:Cytochrome P450 2L1 n=1 Tax=Folsomia candida TaxID=158441 RepID=A0A226DHR6_FOLCA|nr:Cytochrome P450 2L1 [Folsomia candida]